ncbi:UNVERIFIED_CONTAM: WEB family protein [Sesamum angustifolium]|uniref:WEB family protein n=1 Tax=Sesamum angustifolium TaxID=2727405 RepID=A0AAW2KV23_9LAMI
MVAKDYNKTKGSGKAEVGEIDTSAPFQSVKDAVSLFGEGAFSGEKPAIRKAKPQSAEALLELDRAKRTVEDLTQKLKSINESKDSAIRATEAAKHQTKQFAEANNANSTGSDGSANVDRETARAEYAAAVSELDVAKQELRKIRQEYDALIEAKVSATKQAESEKATKANIEKVGELSKEIVGVQDSIQQVKLANAHTKEEEAMICADKDKQKLSYKTRLEELAQKLLALKKDIDPELLKNLETQLGGTLSEIEALRNEMEKTRAADLDSVKTVASELDSAKESLHKVTEEENSLRSLVETLKLELDKLKREHSGLKETEAETESIAGDLHVKLRKAKSELEEALVGEAKARGASDEMVATIHQLVLESQNAKHEAEEVKQQAEELKREAEATRIELEAAEQKLKVAISEAEEAKAAEARALDQIKMLSEKTDAARASTSEPGAQITISKDEFESLSRKVEESEKLAEMKVAAAMAQVEAVKASENEALKRLEATQKEIEDMKAATQEALKKAEMSEAAKKAVEGELRRWREREQKKAVEAASRILSDSGKSFESSPRNYQIQRQRPQQSATSFESSPHNYQIAKQIPQETKVMETRKLEKAKTSVAKKVLMPSLSTVFHKKKNQVEGSSPFSPSEKSSW